MKQHRKFLNQGFSAFLFTQMLGALNDNLYKMFLSLYVLNIIQLPNSEELLFQASLAFTLPFLVFGPWSGYLADRYAKTKVLQWVKLAEVLIMLIGFLATLYHQLELMIFVLFLMGCHSTFFAPAKAGIIPEVVAETEISHANAWLEMTTFFAIILGQALAGALLQWHQGFPIYVNYYLLAFAIVGVFASRYITPTKPSGAHGIFPKNPIKSIFVDLAYLKKSRGLFLAGLGNSYFWLLGLFFQTNIIVYGSKFLHLNDLQNSMLAAYLAIGIGLGSWLAGRLSGAKVELGLVPLGGLGMSLFAIGLYFSSSHYFASAILLFLLGISGGLYIVPLYAFLQFTAAATEKGKVMATVGIMNALFLVLGALLYKLLAIILKLQADQLCLVMGILTIGVVAYICTIIPEYFVRFSAWLMTHTFYRIKIIGQENVPLHGPAMLVVNHISFVDALLVSATIQRFVKFIMWKKLYEMPIVKFFCKIMKVIPIAPYEGRDSVMQSLAKAREQLIAGEVVCIFPEGGITRTGELQPFKKGFETIAEGLDIPIIPVCLHNVWGSIFSFSKKKSFLKLPYPVTVTYGNPLPAHTTAEEAEQIIRQMLQK